MSKFQVTLFMLLSLCTTLTALADEGRGECLKSVKLLSHQNKAYRIGVGVVFSKKWEGGDDDLILKLQKNNGEETMVNVYLQGIEFGATAALEAVMFDFQSMKLTIPNEPNKCVLPMSVFKPFYGTGISAGVSILAGVEVEVSALTNGNGMSLLFGPGIPLGAIGAHASILAFKTMKIRPKDGFYSLDPRFFGREEIDNKINGARDIKW